jgi:hypothetical protein
MQTQTAQTQVRQATPRPVSARTERRPYARPRVVSFAMDAESRKTSLSFNGNL